MITFRNLGRLGRFGNQLFQYAGTRLYAQTNGFAWQFPRWDGEQYFTHQNQRIGLRASLLPTVQLSDIKSTSWRERLLTPLGLWRRGDLSALCAHPQDNINLFGYLQDEFSIDKIRGNAASVRRWFQFKPEIDTALRNATDQYRPWAAAHVRRGDIVKRNLTIPVERYLELLPIVIGDRPLFIASDDPMMRSHFSAYDPFTIRYADFDLPPYIVDFWMLQESDVLVAGGSTFAWWAAFLGGPEYWAPPLSHTWTPGIIPPITRQS